MKKRYLIMIALMLAVGFVSVNAKATVTIATFADPSANSANPLFTVDFQNNLITGGWDDAKTGLTLQIPYSSNNFADAWFSMTNVIINDTFGNTSGGTINFYANNTSTNPLLVVAFDSGHVDYFNFGADSIFVANNVTISGSEITVPPPLSECEFALSFVNKARLSGHTDWADGFTATASFTSSAIPEPATICILGLGALSLVRRKKVA